MNRSLTSRLILSLFLVAIVYLIAITGVLVEYGVKKEKHNMLVTQEKLVMTVKASASIAAYVGNEEIAQEVTDALLLHPEILSVTIESNDGFRYTQPQPQPQLDNRELAAKTPDTYQYFLESPVNQQTIGSIFLTPNIKLQDEKAFSSAEYQVKLLLIQTIVLLIVTFIMINKVVGKPLTAVASQLTRIRPGDTSKLVIDEGHLNDEIGLVTESVNRFVESTTHAIDVERALRKKISMMDKHYRSILEKAQIALFVLDDSTRLIKGNDVLFNNLEKHLHMSREQMMNQNLFQLLMKDVDVGETMVQQALEAKEPITREIVLKSERGAPLWIQLVMSAYKESTSDSWHFEGVMYDVTERVLTAQNALQLAQVDTLTGLGNRLGCSHFVDKFHLNRECEDQRLAILVLDLDGFKGVNDTYGHSAGDEVLCIVAQRLKNQIREQQDLVCRFGGDEFAVLISCRKEQISVVEFIAQKILDTLSQPINLKQGTVVQVGASIGVSMNSELDFDEQIAQADKAMYKVKKQGKNNYAFFE